ncbi:hypothetical protein L6R29_06675 [Myxococcota bacterium]|nr:hypothetical protein [Myxococcota bacterium]
MHTFRFVSLLFVVLYLPLYIGCVGLNPIPTPIDPEVAKAIPGNYNLQFSELRLLLGGAELPQKETGVFESQDGALTVDIRNDGCTASNKRLCLCTDYRICPLRATSGTASITMPQLNQTANNRFDVEASAAGESVKLEGFIDGTRLQFTLGIREPMRLKGIPNIECVRVEESYISGTGQLQGNKFNNRFEGRIQIQWSSGCQLKQVLLNGALRFEYRLVAQKAT